MYVRWKLLFTLGLMLWILLCLTDYVLEEEKNNRLNKTELLDWPSEEVYFAKKLLNEKINRISFSGYISGGYSILVSLLFWNLAALATSFGTCWLVRYIAGRLLYNWWKKRNKQINFIPIQPPADFYATIPAPPPCPPCLVSQSSAISLSPKQSTSTSRIPVAISRTSSQVDVQDAELNVDEPETLEEKALQRTHRSDSSTYANRSVDKRCAEMREELLTMRAAALKENGTLSRKLEALSREKRELSKRLALSSKENRAAKHQMEELLSERALLMGRLESATKELKTNTKTKKIALEKLEEAQSSIERLEQKLEQVTRDKEILDRKFRAIEQELALMKGKDDKFGGRFFLECSVQTDLVQSVESLGDVKEHAIDRAEQVDHIELAEIDMQKIQEKIMSLEKNLEKFSSRRTQDSSDTANSSLETNLDMETESERFYREIENNELKQIDMPLETLKGPKAVFNTSSTEDLYLYPISEECFCSVTEESIPPCIRTRQAFGEDGAESTLEQAELDMQRIQEKIASLEKNLDKFSVKSSAVCAKFPDASGDGNFKVGKESVTVPCDVRLMGVVN